MSKIDIGIKIDLEKLISSRLLVQASSGGGKSYAIRKLSEELSSHVQVIIIDIEGEFVSIREQYPFALVGKEGEIPLNLRYAETLAHKLLETNLSAIIDLSEMEVYQRRLFAKRFAHALIESPKHLWHPCIVIIDEADFFAPQGKESESTNAIVNLSSRGRKRGICPIYATQRIAKLHKDVTADVLNKIVGLTGQDVDQQRAGSELGFTSKQDIIGLRKLSPGEFYAFGPAISNEVIKFKVSKVVTSHMEAGQYKKVAPATPNAIKKILGKLADIPEEAEKELNSKKQFQDEIKRLTAELRKKPTIVAGTVKDEKAAQQVAKLKSDLDKEKKYSAAILSINKNLNSLIVKAKKYNECAAKALEQTSAITLPEQPKQTPSIGMLMPHTGAPTKNPAPHIPWSKPKETGNGIIVGGAMRMLKAAAMFHPNTITRTRMGAFARLSHTSGSFGTYLSSLKTNGYIITEGNDFRITDEGLAAAGNVDSLPTDPNELINLWCGIIGESSGAARMLRVLGGHYPNEMSRQELGDAVNMSSTSGSFGTYLSYLKSRGLVKTSGQNIKASEELFL